MQDDGLTSSCRGNDPTESDNGERETFYDIWQADDLSTGKSDDGYSESTPRFDNYAENHCTSSCISNNSSNKSQRSHSGGNIDVRTIEADERARGGWASNKGDICPVNCLADGRTRKVDEDDTAPNENLIHKDVDSIGCKDELRMRGGCGGCCCGASRERLVKRYVGMPRYLQFPLAIFGIEERINPL